MVSKHRPRPLLIIGAVLLVASLALPACSSGGEPAPVQEIQPAGASPSAKQGTTQTFGTDTTSSTPDPAATGTANVDVSPAEVGVANVVLTLSIQPPQPAFDPGRSTSSASTGDQQSNDQQKPAVQRGFAVLGGNAIKVTNNFDGAQSPPADQAKSVLRHVAVQIKDKASGQLIPYVVVSMDLLREGRPTLQDQPLIPMVQADSGAAQMHYGNNVIFPGRGDYQIFIRMERSPLLGSGSLGVAQFNVSIK